MKKMITGKSLAWLFAYIYFTSYVTRINFAAVIQEVVTSTGYEKSALSVILVCMSVSYGVGQIINGWIGDRIKPQNLIFIGLITATSINLIFPFFTSTIPLMSILWAINGFAQAMMWPPIVKIMVSTMDEETYSSASVIISLGSSIGTIFVYLTAPLIITVFSWEFVLFSSAVAGLISVVLWAFLKDLTYDENAILPETKTKSTLKIQGAFFPKDAIFPIVFIGLAVIFQGMLRDGVANWMPSLLSETFQMGNSKSILCTVSLSAFSIVAFILAGAFYKRFFKNEVACSAAIFAMATVAALLLSILLDKGAVVAIIFMALITGANHGVNLMLIGHVPKRFRKYGNISTISGAVNSCTYVGSAVATYGIAKISESYGWLVTVISWLVIAALGTVCCLVAMPKWKKFIEK
jgi:OPA family glycerol-3-phosphate transporter-like MFS transporter